MKRVPKWARTVTPFSKTLALLIFISFPIIAFYLGIQYQKLLELQNERVSCIITSASVK